MYSRLVVLRDPVIQTRRHEPAILLLLKVFSVAFMFGFLHNLARFAGLPASYGGRTGSLAIAICKPRQARKGATVAGTLCAEM